MEEANNEEDFYSIVDSKEESQESIVFPYQTLPPSLTGNQVGDIIHKHESDHSKQYLKIRHPTAPLPKTASIVFKTPKQAGKNPFLED